MAIPEKQKRFADEWLIDMNGTRAYKTAYTRVKSDSVASANAARLLRNAKVAEYIAEKQKALQSRTGVTQERVIKALSDIGLADVDMELLKPADKLKALELLGKHLGMFEKQQDTGGAVITEFVKALHAKPEDVAALYADEEDNGTDN